MKKNIVSAMALSMAAVVALPASAFAATSLTNSTASVAEDLTNTTKVGKDENQAKETVYSDEIAADAPTNECKVYATQASTFSVVIPKTIILNGAKGAANTGAYVVTAKGNLGGTERVTVAPDATFKMSQAGKADIDATVAQVKTNFVVDERTFESFATGMTEDNTSRGVDLEAGATADGLVTVADLSAGSWAGQFNFAIGLTTDGVVAGE